MSKLISTIFLTGFPIVIFVVSYLITPEYYGPMFKQPMGIMMLVGEFILLAVGFFVLMITRGWLRGILAVFFTTTALLITMLGPAIITIASALGPVMSSDDGTSPASTLDKPAAKSETTNSTTGSASKPKKD